MRPSRHRFISQPVKLSEHKDKVVFFLLIINKLLTIAICEIVETTCFAQCSNFPGVYKPLCSIAGGIRTIQRCDQGCEGGFIYQ